MIKTLWGKLPTKVNRIPTEQPQKYFVFIVLYKILGLFQDWGFIFYV